MNKFLKRAFSAFALLAFCTMIPMQAMARGSHGGGHRGGFYRPAPRCAHAPHHGGHGYHHGHHRYGISKGRMNAILAIDTILGVAAVAAACSTPAQPAPVVVQQPTPAPVVIQQPSPVVIQQQPTPAPVVVQPVSEYYYYTPPCR